jgi:hypothetical protein
VKQGSNNVKIIFKNQRTRNNIVANIFNKARQGSNNVNIIDKNVGAIGHNVGYSLHCVGEIKKRGETSPLFIKKNTLNAMVKPSNC